MKKEELTLKEMFEEHQKKEPEEFDRRFKEVGIDFESDEHRGWRMMLDRLTALLNVSEEKRKEILRVIKTGKTLGEVRKEFEETLDVVSDILYFNINKVHILKEVSI